jgi:hypothetical protein
MLQLKGRGAHVAAAASGLLWAVTVSVEPVAAHEVVAHSTSQTAESVVTLLPLVALATGFAAWRHVRGRGRR